MPVPLAPYPPQSAIPMQPPQGSQSQLYCSGCRTLLVYPHGATNVRCALCNCVTAVPPHGGTEMAQLICGGCRTMLMYLRGATTVQCTCCHTVNLAMDANQMAYVNCGGCNTTLAYGYGAHSVRCAVCQFVTSIPMSSMSTHLPMQRPPFVPRPQAPPVPVPSPRPQTQTVVVENPMTLDESGKLVSNVAVGVTTGKK
ncbi:hypothetical protein O6H91_07G099900 [Diphasiastrum complanatum]|uniref:Uncharacterized protein n=2 Tax=Diphasiastrum complanatum TaxID=34168 RepID=A0ACC2D8D6_DIPCM|nr:hypothetical protein O6H91_Y128400 [Diphasiastrum complanatum]KAJ7550418.1 hypothetical protein O6H91_07G099900 [Diphasiastrum complanatum]